MLLQQANTCEVYGMLYEECGPVRIVRYCLINDVEDAKQGMILVPNPIKKFKGLTRS
jgi:hypothetical protein